MFVGCQACICMTIKPFSKNADNKSGYYNFVIVHMHADCPYACMRKQLYLMKIHHCIVPCQGHENMHINSARPRMTN